MTKGTIVETFKKQTDYDRMQNAWGAQLDSDIALAARSAASVLITAPSTAADAIVRAIATRQQRALPPQILTYYSGAGHDLISALEDGRRAAARRGTAAFWLKEVHRLEQKAQEALAGELANRQRWTGGKLQIISSSTGDLFDSVTAGIFDAGLFYRLNTIHIMVPKELR